MTFDINKAASDAAERHRIFYDAIRGRTLGFIKKSVRDRMFISPSASITAIALSYLRGENKIASDEADLLSFETVTEIGDMLGKTVNVDFKFDIKPLSDLLAFQANGDVNQMVSAVRTATVMTSKIRNNFGRSDEGASLAALDISPTFKDASGKNWKGDVFNRTLWRKFYVDVKSESAISALRSAGEKFAKVKNKEGHEADGLIFSIDGDFQYRTWEEVRDKFFHPNTSCSIVPANYGG